MMMSGKVCGGLVLAMVCSLPMMAQQAGTVSGHVTCGDTQRPARFATVVLLGVPQDTGPVTPPAAGVTGAKDTVKFVMDGGTVVLTETELDGSYWVGNVAPGDYYVFASVPGYVQPQAVVQAAIDTGADPKKQLPGIPVVHVGGEGGASMDITAQRGGAISGHVTWDDGSPASKAYVTAVSTKATGKNRPSDFMMLGMAEGLNSGGEVSISDDLGQYRIAGLAPGEYVVKATVLLHTGFAMQRGVMNVAEMDADKPLVVYAPGMFHKAEAKAVTVHAADEITGEDLTIKVTGMHSVSGRVVSAEDGHGLNSGAVVLTDASDKDVVRGAGVDASGNFTVGFVPPGTYNLTVSGGADTGPAKKTSSGPMQFMVPDTLQRYDGGKQSVAVGDSDVVGLNVALSPLKAAKSQ
ncbi:MAG: carboxypeptidase-like regulatory domain-containing protein [Acidobacteriaceae bacterium]